MPRKKSAVAKPRAAKPRAAHYTLKNRQNPCCYYAPECKGETRGCPGGSGGYHKIEGKNGEKVQKKNFYCVDCRTRFWVVDPRSNNLTPEHDPKKKTKMPFKIPHEDCEDLTPLHFPGKITLAGARGLLLSGLDVCNRVIGPTWVRTKERKECLDDVEEDDQQALRRFLGVPYAYFRFTEYTICGLKETTVMQAMDHEGNRMENRFFKPVVKPSALERAEERAKIFQDCAVSALIIRAAKLDLSVWSAQSHEFFPDASRARAVATMRLAYKLSWSLGDMGLIDVWKEFVMPFAITR